MAKETVENENTAEDITVTLNLDSGDVECQVITVLDSGDRSYIALLPMDGPDAGKGSVYLYRYKDDSGEPEIEYIDNDEEYDLASDLFDEYLDTVEFDELIEEDGE